jgi:hypothetical protein
MAKKRRKRRPPPRPTLRPEQAPARTERKEEARKEREARIRRARRRVLLRRLTRLGIVIVLAGLIAGFIYWRGGESRRETQEALAAAERLGCTEVQDLPDEGREHLAPGEAPPAYGSTPATSGKHSGATLPADPSVYDQPFDANLEAQAVHNLEHGYVLIYYKQDGPDALPNNVVDTLADLARSEEKVMLAPHAELPEDQSLAIAAWTHLQTCPNVTNAGDVVDVARGFINRFRGGGDAPEPNQP